MSLILEALRKSEAERRRGLMPDLRAELPPAPTRVAATAWPWRNIAAGLALLALAAWLATSPWRSHPATPASDADERHATALPRVPHLQPMAAAPPRAHAERQMPSRTIAEKTASSEARGVRPAAPPAFDAGPPVSVTAAGHGSPSRGEGGRDIAIHVASAAAPPRATAAATTPATGNATGPAALPDIAPPSPPLQSTGSGNAPLQLSDLAPGERKALPPLRLSMHLWNDDPARRFVILDGNRLGEGDRIGDLVVTAIVRDGVLLDWNGRALKVPLR
ncbi:MAG: GspB domain-containing protein [Lysobacter sp.]|nr:GspB domain-containing protein [Lysobacter sp.]